MSKSDVPVDEDLCSATALDEFLVAHATELAEYRLLPGDDLERRTDKGRGVLRWLYKRGAHGWGWPDACGGRGGNAVHRAIFYDAMTRHGFGIPEPTCSLEVQGDALVKFAPHIASRVLPGLLNGSDVWCQGFSEPQAGSDLASLRTRASRVAGGWVLNGQKVWTSLAHIAQWCGVLARTGAPDSRHKGLSYFWVPLPSSGLEARPLRTLTGEDDFCELFFDDVFVADDLLVGEVGQGWEIAMYALQYERGMWAWQRQALMHSGLEHALANADNRERFADDIGRAYLNLQAVRAMSMSTVKRLASGEALGPEVSADKLLLGQTEHMVNDLIRDLTPDFGLGDTDADRAIRREWFYSRAATVYGGAADIQRNIIAGRVLGLTSAGQRG